MIVLPRHVMTTLTDGVSLIVDFCRVQYTVETRETRANFNGDVGVGDDAGRRRQTQRTDSTRKCIAHVSTQA